VPLPHHSSGSRSSYRVLAAGLVVSVLVTAGCGRGPAPDAPQAPKLTMVRRLIDPGQIAGEDPRLERGSHVFLASQARPVLSSGRAFKPEFDCEPAAADKPRARRCSALVPATMPAAPLAILERKSGLPTKGKLPLATPIGDPSKSVVLAGDGAPVDVGKLTAMEMLLAHTYPVPALADRTLETEPFTVPSEALLRLSIGVEEPAWWIDSAPLSFRLIVVDEAGNTQDLFRRVLDPARRPADRRWFDSDVDLSDLAGSKIRLRFVTDPAEKGDTRPSLPLWGDPRLLAPAAPPARPSIVLISLDTLRAKSMSTYGYALDTSPKISALAARGALFEHAFTTFSNTLPSHMSMLTGLYPGTHAVMDTFSVLGPEHATLAEVLRRAGFATAAFTEDALLDSRRGFRRGFSTYYENTSIEDGLGDAEGTFGRALEWAGRNADERFFLFVHTYEVHSPYDPPAAYQILFPATEGQDVSVSRRAYEQEIRYLDDVLQRFVDGLRKVVPDDELLLIVTADHGEEFTEHGMVSHNQLYEEVMHIPLVMVWSGRIPAGLRIATPVSLVDIAPTVLALAEVAEATPIDGLSLVPLLSEAPAALAREAVFGEFPATWATAERHFVARSADAKCILTASGNGDFCLDLVRDPKEVERRATQDTIAFSRLHGLADAYRTRSLRARVHIEDVRQQGKVGSGPATIPTPNAAPAQAADAPPDHDLDPVERKLRALGYVE